MAQFSHLLSLARIVAHFWSVSLKLTMASGGKLFHRLYLVDRITFLVIKSNRAGFESDTAVK